MCGLSLAVASRGHSLAAVGGLPHRSSRALEHRLSSCSPGLTLRHWRSSQMRIEPMSPVMTGRFVIHRRPRLWNRVGKPQASQISLPLCSTLHHKWFHTHVCVRSTHWLTCKHCHLSPQTRHPLLTLKPRVRWSILGRINLVMGRVHQEGSLGLFGQKVPHTQSVV